MPHNHYPKGYIQVYTGNGKGKTTAAIGVSIRSIGSGLKVFFGQFMKNAVTSEHIIFDNYPESIICEQFGTGRFIRGKPSPEDYERASHGWQKCLDAIISGTYDLVVMDELNMVLYLKLLPLKNILKVLKDKPLQTEIIITGRNAPEALVEIADLVTEMKEIKHYYHQGVPARQGIEE